MMYHNFQKLLDANFKSNFINSSIKKIPNQDFNIKEYVYEE